MWNVDIDVDSSEVNEIRQEWENKAKGYTFQFFDLDPSVVSPSILSTFLCFDFVNV